MKRTLRVVTEARFCKETGQPPVHAKPFGYVVQITPPIVTYSTTCDADGVGTTHHPPKRHEQHTVGWYKFKIDALMRWGEAQTFKHLFVDDQTLPDARSTAITYLPRWA